MGHWAWAERKLAQVSPGEQIIHALKCKHGKYTRGWLVATDRRIWWFGKGLLFSTSQDEYSYNMPVAVDKVFLGSTCLVIGNEQFQMSTANAEQFATTIRQVRDEMVPLNPLPVQSVSVADELKKLAELRDAGILTDTEFQTKKVELLKRM
jgi:hypothetical protein